MPDLARRSDREVQVKLCYHQDLNDYQRLLGGIVLENYIDHMGIDSHFANDDFEPAGLPTWCAFALGGIITFLFVYIGIARPAAREMSLMRRQMSTLEQSVWEVAGQKETAASTNELLGLLNEQREQAIAAKRALVEMRQLHSDIISESKEIQNAMVAASQLGSLKDMLLANSEEADKAAEVLTVSEDLYHRLATGSDTTDKAVQASENLFALRSGLIDHGSEVAAAQDNLDELIALKDSVVSQTGSLADAIETLELTTELGVRFHEAALSFDQIRHWMVEIVAMEPMLQRCQKTLEPLTQLTSLDRMAPTQLRQVARAMVGGYKAQVATKPVESKMEDAVDSEFDFTLDLAIDDSDSSSIDLD